MVNEVGVDMALRVMGRGGMEEYEVRNGKVGWCAGEEWHQEC